MGSSPAGNVSRPPFHAPVARLEVPGIGPPSSQKSIYRGGILGDSIGSRVHLPLSVERPGKNGRNIGLPPVQNIRLPASSSNRDGSSSRNGEWVQSAPGGSPIPSSRFGGRTSWIAANFSECSEPPGSSP